MYNSNPSLGDFVRGPLTKTPQGWVVLASAALYLVIALAAINVGGPLLLGKDVAATVIVCVAWPLIVGLMFVKHNAPGRFAPSWTKAALLVLVAAAPLAYSHYLNEAGPR